MQNSMIMCIFSVLDQKYTLLANLSSGMWSNLGPKIFYSNKISKLIKIIHDFPTFQGPIHETNLIALGSLK